MDLVDVALDWKSIDWLPKETWKKDTLPKLQAEQLNLADLERCVYVIRLNGDYCVEYPNGFSPTLYIGEGNFNQRINQHKKIWVTELKDLVGEFSFRIKIAVPRIQKNAEAYKDCEAALLIRFNEKLGATPLWNSYLEKRKNGHYVYKQKQIDQAIFMGSGAKYKWAFKPMKASKFYKDYIRTHG
jgi:hypothetical protein